MKPIKIIIFFLLYLLFSLLLLLAFIENMYTDSQKAFIYLIGSLGFLTQIWVITHYKHLEIKEHILNHLKQKNLIHY